MQLKAKDAAPPRLQNKTAAVTGDSSAKRTAWTQVASADGAKVTKMQVPPKAAVREGNSAGSGRAVRGAAPPGNARNTEVTKKSKRQEEEFPQSVKRAKR